MRSMVRGSALIIVGCVALRGAAAAAAVPTVHVPGDFATIQEAVDALGSSGTVEVAAGQYLPFTVGGAASGRDDRGYAAKLTIHGDRDAVIDGGAGPAIGVVGAVSVVVDGFTVVSRDVGVSVVLGRDIAVQNVTVRSAGSDGIRADTVTDIKVTGNLVESAGGIGIDVMATTSEIYGPLTVTSNTVLSAAGDGILVHNFGDGADTEVSDNVVTNADGRGIRTECGMTLDLARNDVSATGGTAVSVYQLGRTATVTQNQIADSGGKGIEIQNAPQIVVTDNRIERTAGDAVSVAALDVHVDRNTVADAGGTGIRVGQQAAWGVPEVPVTGGPPTVSDNVVTGPAGTGIVLAVDGPFGPGDFLDYARPLQVVGNSVTDAGVHGIELDGAQGTRVKANKVAGAGDCGFRLENGARGNVLTRNTAMDCSPGLWAVGVAKKNRIAKSNRFGRRRVRR